MVPFAGWSLPVMYPSGIKAEHLHTRAEAGLFDVSHMGQIVVHGDGAETALEAILPTALSRLRPGQMRYSLLLDNSGGILDDLVITNCGDHYLLVVNADRTAVDHAYLQAALPSGARADLMETNAMMALQGPLAGAVLAELIPESEALYFMESAIVTWEGATVQVCRSGYTGEDGFELCLPAHRAESLAGRLLEDSRVMPAGLGARDSLRLEAGLPLYGNDIDTETRPVEAGLTFAIAKSRRTKGDFPGAAAVLSEMEHGPARRRVGLRPEGRRIVRPGARIDFEGQPVGRVTSGGFGPSVDAPVAMGYVKADLAEPGQSLAAEVRGRCVPLVVQALPFVPHRYKLRSSMSAETEKAGR